MPGQRVIAVKVEWDSKWPTVVYVPVEVMAEYDADPDEDAVSEYLSDQHGFLVKSWEVASEND